MKRVLLLLVSFVAISFAATAEDKNKKAEANKEINWMTVDEVQVAMKKEPKKVLIDFYTSWCGWCKVMDKKTYTNPDVIKYVNEKFYAVKFDAEQKESVMFLGKTYEFSAGKRANEFAALFLGERLSYPSTVFMTEQFQNPSLVAGYQDVPKMEMILNFLGENKYQNVKWEDHMKDYKPVFTVMPEPAQPLQGLH